MGGLSRETSQGNEKAGLFSLCHIDVDRNQRAPMNIIYGQCEICEKTDQYTDEDMQWIGMVACKKCGSKYVWRIYTDVELDRMRKGERVE